jgi:hypothetical protein
VPDPVSAPVKEIQDAPDADDVHAQVESVVTLMVPVPPAWGTVTVNGATVKVHVAGCSVTVKVLPAIVNVAVLVCVFGFAVAAIPTLPEPVRFVPFEIVTHDDPLVADQVQLAPVVTFTVVLPPAAANI